jgi:ligand-binding SRPBCC domain-containing protein
LKEITPPEMGFNVINGPLPDKVYPGMIIIYKVSPLLNIPMRWVTEITQVEAPNYFIDNQKAGPYAFWHHQHFFKETKDGVVVSDLLSYKVPLGILGQVLERLIVKRKVEKIFEYRKKRLKMIFG